MKNINSAFQNHVRSKDERILKAKSLQSFKFSSIGRAGSCPKPIAGMAEPEEGVAHASPDFG